jgi:hypothetical protein
MFGIQTDLYLLKVVKRRGREKKGRRGEEGGGCNRSDLSPSSQQVGRSRAFTK